MKTVLILSLIAMASAVTGAEARAQVSYLPIGTITAGMSNKLINLGVAPDSRGPGIEFTAPDATAGFRAVRFEDLDFKVGAYAGWFLQNGTFTGSLFGAGGGIIPVAGATVVSTRFVADEKDAAKLPKFRIPHNAEALKSWKQGDSVFYDNRGGVIFTAGVGYAGTGLSGDYFAQGEWTTYVEKLAGEKVFLKLSKVRLSDFDIVLGNALVNETASKFDKVDKYFAYVFDLADGRAANAYELMLRGDVKTAQELAKSNPTIAFLDLSEKGGTSGYQTKEMLGVPFLNVSHTAGELYNYSDTDYASTGAKSDVEYGLYWSDVNSDVFTRNKDASKTFYGISSRTTTASGQMIEAETGKMTLSYENDHADGKTISRALADMVKHTGLSRELQVLPGAPSGKLGYLHLTLTMTIPDATTKKLMALNSQGALEAVSADSAVHEYYGIMGETESETAVADTTGALGELRKDLAHMSRAESAHDRKAFVEAYREFGKHLLKDKVSFAVVSNLAHGSPLDAVFEAEGTKIARLTKRIDLESALPALPLR